MSASTKEEMLKQLLNERVRPMLIAHGGDVEFVSVTDDNHLVVRLMGACSGCPASRMTLEDTVATAVREAWPELAGIEVAETVREDMIAQARAILGGHH